MQEKKRSSLCHSAAVKVAFHDTDIDTDTGSNTDLPDTPTPSQGCKRVGRVGEEPREDVDVAVGVDVGVVECGLN